MPDLSFVTPPPRPELLRELRHTLLDAQPELRIVAQGLLGAQTPIDFVGIEASGRLVLVLVADDDRDLELLARGLAQRAWVEPRVSDWPMTFSSTAIGVGRAPTSIVVRVG